MAAILGGTMRSPLTGIVFALELTHDINSLLPLVIGVFVAHGFTVLTLRRSILTEKISRRGYHLSREYAVDPLEILFVREVMRTNIVAIPATISTAEIPALHPDGARTVQHLYPVVDAREQLVGIVTRHDLQRLAHDAEWEHHSLLDVVRHDPVVAYADEPLRLVAYRMAETGLTRFPVVTRADPHRILGIVALTDLLRARERNLLEERHRERHLRMHLFAPRGRRIRDLERAEREPDELTVA
jgi:CBS domain-containing protein